MSTPHHLLDTDHLFPLAMLRPSDPWQHEAGAAARFGDGAGGQAEGQVLSLGPGYFYLGVKTSSYPLILAGQTVRIVRGPHG